MKHNASHFANSNTHKVQEEIKNLLSILMGILPEEAQDTQNFASLQEKATSPEDIAILEELQKSSQKLEEKAKNYRDSIGTIKTAPSKSTSHKTNTQRNITSHTIQKIPTVSREENTKISRIKEDFDIEH